MKGYDDSLNAERPKTALPLRLSSGDGGLGSPSSLDYRDQGIVSPVKDQGSCGSCWAFSTTAQYESLIARNNGSIFDLAEQYVLQCTSGSSCNGGIPIDAIDVMV